MSLEGNLLGADIERQRLGIVHAGHLGNGQRLPVRDATSQAWSFWLFSRHNTQIPGKCNGSINKIMERKGR